MTAFRGFIGPGQTSSGVSISSVNSVTIDDAAKKWVAVFQAAKTGTLTNLSFRYTSRTGIPVQHQISLQGVEGLGFHDGVIFGATNNVKATFTPPADSTWNATWKETGDGAVGALGETVTVTQGLFYAMVIEALGAADASNFSVFSVAISGFSGIASSYLPYHAFNGAKQNYAPIFGYTVGGQRYGIPILFPLATSFAGDTGTFDEYGVAFKLPLFLPAGSTGIVDRWAPDLRTPPTGKTIKAILYQDTTPLQEVTLDSDHCQAQGLIGRVLFRLGGTPAVLTAGTEYILAAQPQGTGEAMTMNAIQVPAVSDLIAFAEWQSTSYAAD